jgi:hypothetical protein
LCVQALAQLRHHPAKGPFMEVQEQPGFGAFDLQIRPEPRSRQYIAGVFQIPLWTKL